MKPNNQEGYDFSDDFSEEERFEEKEEKPLVMEDKLKEIGMKNQDFL